MGEEKKEVREDRVEAARRLVLPSLKRTRPYSILGKKRLQSTSDFPFYKEELTREAVRDKIAYLYTTRPALQIWLHATISNHPHLKKEILITNIPTLIFNVTSR